MSRKKSNRPFNPLPGMAKLAQERMNRLFPQPRTQTYTPEEIAAWKARLEPTNKKKKNPPPASTE